MSDGVWHEWPVRVYYEDTDAEGVVYFANYLKFMERGRTEWLRELGLEQDALRERHRICFTISETDVRFRRPARFNDRLTVRTRLDARRGARLTLTQAVRRAGEDDDLVVARCVAACVDAEAFRPRRMPAEVLERLPG